MPHANPLVLLMPSVCTLLNNAPGKEVAKSFSCCPSELNFQRHSALACHCCVPVYSLAQQPVLVYLEQITSDTRILLAKNSRTYLFQNYEYHVYFSLENTIDVL